MRYLLLAFCISLATCSSAQKEKKATMDIIYVCHYHIFKPYIEYKIDLKNKTFWTYSVAKSGKPRNETGKNEGYDLAGYLDSNKIAAFLSDAAKNRFDRWEKEYINPDIDGGSQWSIAITFDDGSVKTINGSNQYPETWNEMNLAFKHLTGKDYIL
jgi:hypothetical protein